MYSYNPDTTVNRKCMLFMIFKIKSYLTDQDILAVQRERRYYFKLFRKRLSVNIGKINEIFFIISKMKKNVIAVFFVY